MINSEDDLDAKGRDDSVQTFVYLTYWKFTSSQDGQKSIPLHIRTIFILYHNSPKTWCAISARFRMRWSRRSPARRRGRWRTFRRSDWRPNKIFSYFVKDLPIWFLRFRSKLVYKWWTNSVDTWLDVLHFMLVASTRRSFRRPLK